MVPTKRRTPRDSLKVEAVIRGGRSSRLKGCGGAVPKILAPVNRGPADTNEWTRLS